MSSAKREVHQFVLDNLLFGRAEPQLSDEASFVELGIIDSTGVLELVTFLEDTYQFKIEDEELIPANLDSVEAICRFVEAKRVASVHNSKQGSHAS